MKTYDALDVRRFCEQGLRTCYPGHAKQFKEMQNVVVSADFARYVAAMTEAWPQEEMIQWPSMADVRWPFMDQSVLFIFEEVIQVEFLLTSYTDNNRLLPMDPTPDEQPVIALCVLDNRATSRVEIRTRDSEQRVIARHGDLPPEIQPQHSLFIHPNALVTDGNFGWGLNIMKHEHHPYLGYCARWERSFVEAVGHRMSMLTEPRYERMPRPERRAIQRSLGPYRLLQLRTRDRATASSAGTHPVAWSKRWAVRGHWRNQPYGPRNNPEYRQKWIDPYIKGPEDMPLDIRPTVFNLGKRPQDRLFKMGEHRGESG